MKRGIFEETHIHTRLKKNTDHQTLIETKHNLIRQKKVQRTIEEHACKYEHRESLFLVSVQEENWSQMCVLGVFRGARCRYQHRRRSRQLVILRGSLSRSRRSVSAPTSSQILPRNGRSIRRADFVYWNKVDPRSRSQDQRSRLHMH